MMQIKRIYWLYRQHEESDHGWRGQDIGTCYATCDISVSIDPSEKKGAEFQSLVLLRFQTLDYVFETCVWCLTLVQKLKIVSTRGTRVEGDSTIRVSLHPHVFPRRGKLFIQWCWSSHIRFRISRRTCVIFHRLSLKLVPDRLTQKSSLKHTEVKI